MKNWFIQSFALPLIHVEWKSRRTNKRISHAPLYCYYYGWIDLCVVGNSSPLLTEHFFFNFMHQRALRWTMLKFSHGVFVPFLVLSQERSGKADWTRCESRDLIESRRSSVFALCFAFLDTRGASMAFRSWEKRKETTNDFKRTFLADTQEIKFIQLHCFLFWGWRIEERNYRWCFVAKFRPSCENLSFRPCCGWRVIPSTASMENSKDSRTLQSSTDSDHREGFIDLNWQLLRYALKNKGVERASTMTLRKNITRCCLNQPNFNQPSTKYEVLLLGEFFGLCSNYDWRPTDSRWLWEKAFVFIREKKSPYINSGWYAS